MSDNKLGREARAVKTIVQALIVSKCPDRAGNIGSMRIRCGLHFILRFTPATGFAFLDFNLYLWPSLCLSRDPGIWSIITFGEDCEALFHIRNSPVTTAEIGLVNSER